MAITQTRRRLQTEAEKYGRELQADGGVKRVACAREYGRSERSSHSEEKSATPFQGRGGGGCVWGLITPYPLQHQRAAPSFAPSPPLEARFLAQRQRPIKSRGKLRGGRLMKLISLQTEANRI